MPRIREILICHSVLGEFMAFKTIHTINFKSFSSRVLEMSMIYLMLPIPALLNFHIVRTATFLHTKNSVIAFESLYHISSILTDETSKISSVMH